VAAIIYDFKVFGAKLRKQRLDEWWQPAKPEPGKATRHGLDQNDVWPRYVERVG
jgi:hypothetical protein